jgi:hypothetical protein
VSRLQREVLRFSVSGYFSQVSCRHAHHRYYRLARKGLDVPRTWQAVQQAIADLEASETACWQHNLGKGVGNNLSAIMTVQHVMHLIEYVLVSVYCAHLWHMFASDNKSLKEWVDDHLFDADWFVSLGVVLAAFLGVLVVALLNSLAGHRTRDSKVGRKARSRQNGEAGRDVP